MKARTKPFDFLAYFYSLAKYVVVEKQIVYSMKICVNIDNYFSVDVQVNRFQSSIKQYFWFADDEETNKKKLIEIIGAIQSSPGKQETLHEHFKNSLKEYENQCNNFRKNLKCAVSGSAVHFKGAERRTE